jgi:hypothetical protein
MPSVLYVNYLIIIGTLVIIEFMACQSTQKSTENCSNTAIVSNQFFAQQLLPCGVISNACLQFSQDSF